MTPPAPDWHLKDAAETSRALGVDAIRGLSTEQVCTLARQYGPNHIAVEKNPSLFSLVWAQINDFMILVLAAAAVLSGLMGDWQDALVILVIVVLNASIGIVQSWRADRALASLRSLCSPEAKVLRAGQIMSVQSADLVPGDIVILEAGQQVPADLRLIESAQLKIDESSLTGESVTVDKITAPLSPGDTTVLADRVNMAFKGTSATHGRGRGLVVATGMQTELGKIAKHLQSDLGATTPLKQRLAVFGKRIAIAVLGICALIFGVGVLRGEPPVQMMLLAVSLAVAAIPEALPAVVTVLLALGARRMVSFNALVRHLTAVETLGSVSHICTDKTGTLTQNRMQVERLVVQGVADVDERRFEPTALGKAHNELLRAAALCNDASLAADGRWQGDPTETALADCAALAGQNKTMLEAGWPRVLEQPFDATQKRMTTFHRASRGYVAYTKGAPESVIPLCILVWPNEPPDQPQPFNAAAWLERASIMAAQGQRVLAVARQSHEHLPEAGGEIEAVEGGLCLIGLIGLVDPPRPEAAQAVQECLSAGITPIMITGDHPATARFIALQTGIVSDPNSPVLTGANLSTMSDEELRLGVRSIRLYARVDPAQKIRIVQALQDQGEFVAMTGDGINDAPALRHANIGVAMGKSGTDVAREAASMVLLDDNFATIVRAVREGRCLYDNIRKFIRYAMTGNSGEIWTIALAPMLLMPTPLLPVHILWVNLVTDGLPGLALASEPAEQGIMQRPPRPPSESLFSHGMWQHILGIGLLIGGLCLAVQAWALSSGNAHAQTMVFTVLTLSQMAHLLAIRSETTSLWQLGLLSNKPLLAAVLLSFALQMATVYVPALNPLFKTQALNSHELGLCLAAAGTVWLVVETEKYWRRRRQWRSTPAGVKHPTSNAPPGSPPQ